MGKTSTASKRKYNDKTSQRWFADLRKEDFEAMEEARGELSRAAFLRELLAVYQVSKENKA